MLSILDFSVYELELYLAACLLCDLIEDQLYDLTAWNPDWNYDDDYGFDSYLYSAEH